MPAMAVIFTPSFPARRFLGVLVRMAIISFPILPFSWRLSRSTTLLSSATQGVFRPVTLHLPVFFTVSCLVHGCRSCRPKLGIPWDWGCGCGSRQ